MLVSGKAIVIHYTRYSDSSIIVHLFTDFMGRVPVMFYGIKGRQKSKIAAFQPLYLIDVVIDHKPKRNIQVLKEHHLNPPLINLSSDVIKSSLSIFLAEVLQKCLREEAPDELIFTFLSTSIKVLDEIKTGIGLFHIFFLLKLSRYLGFNLNNDETSFTYFDLKQMAGKTQKPVHDFYISKKLFKQLLHLYNIGFNDLEKQSFSIKERNCMLETIIKIYELHAINFNSLKSFDVLKTVFS